MPDLLANLNPEQLAAVTLPNACDSAGTRPVPS